jgi:hypothetical protein
MVRMSALAIALLLPATAAPIVAQTPGVVIEMTSIDHRDEPARTDVSRVRIAGSNVAMEVEGVATGNTMIFRGDEEAMIAVDHDRRTYLQIDQEQMAALAERMNAAMAQMERMLENLPAEQRAMIERMREQGGGMPGMEALGGMADRPEIDVRDTGRSETRSGYSARVWEVYEDGELARRVWIAPWSEIEGGETARDAMAGMVSFFDSFLESLPTEGVGAMMSNPFRYLDLSEGMPVLTHELSEDGSIEQETSVSSVQRQQIGPETFEAPEGYTRQQMPGG